MTTLLARRSGTFMQSLNELPGAEPRASGNYKHGYGFHPLGAYADETREALAMLV